MERSQKIVRSTDYDALSCRLSAATKHYIDDPFLPRLIIGFEKFLKYEYSISSKRIYNSIVNSKKLPIINRGTFIRTKSIDLVIERFLKKFKSEKVQILSLGAGSDTRPFKLLYKNKSHFKYIEVDFKSSTTLKEACIRNDPVLSGIVGIETNSDENLEQFYASCQGEIISEFYELIPCDIRNTGDMEKILSVHLDSTVPTLIISECVLCYLESQQANKMIQALHSYFDKLALAIYDPIGGEDNFGHIMVDNLKIRNISMPSLLQYNTIDKYITRLTDLQIPNVYSDNMYNILNNWIDEEEKTRVSKLEFLDEIEELKLLLQHYCLTLGVSGFDLEDLSLTFGFKNAV